MLNEAIKAFRCEELRELMHNEGEDIELVDIRRAADFCEGFIPGSVFLGLTGQFKEYASALLHPRRQIILVAPEGELESGVALLSEAGLANIAGYVKGGLEAWKELGDPRDMIINVDAGEMAMDIPFDKNLVVLDVRQRWEFAEGHVQGAVNLPVAEMKDPLNIAQFDERDNLYLHSAYGYRSVIAASLLKIQGYHNLRNVTGGWDSIQHTRGIKIEKESASLN